MSEMGRELSHGVCWISWIAALFLVFVAMLQELNVGILLRMHSAVVFRLVIMRGFVVIRSIASQSHRT